ncbi:cytochrome o ubiquinol oxidase subunit IV [Solidesulfovibrio sp.]|uniref:cytochrome o ubiquinol oxidase subunit IV n=1 Tax=Solidesulfovibrio sp. TaxID=2910990 RepID=UPI002625C216|nr:cytochrome o ubiquinol oxidase subunit IV [Solidesulfovibrio sp.]
MRETQPDGGRAGAALARAYLTGFCLSLLLTAAPFVAVMTGALSPGATVFCVFAAAALQMVVQLRYFLHVDASRAMHWNLMSLLFTFFIVFLFVGGSIWIMHSLHYRM